MVTYNKRHVCSSFSAVRGELNEIFPHDLMLKGLIHCRMVEMNVLSQPKADSARLRMVSLGVSSALLT